ncbi:bifunctional glycosyltransferase family 2/GtrA family protein [Marinilactibacillus piezotolerans]|uniref:bifunctional glycosyltransferase family 2/GtrA family protein n=1 Tax=Marinilactibacillus piezotolerans TaxID=258723 RepID=UPI0009B02367|nr:bifunctional glycosyltransferase family 2/GtrA family protein [Marinilactibacillus piezotolerans]
MKKTLIVIPAYNPGNEMIHYVDELVKKGYQSILVIDDGSKAECKHIFKQLDQNKEVTLINHSINLGKGRALKNAINYFLNMPNLEQWTGMITVDSDGQHLVSDVEKLAKELEANPTTLILGARDFNSKMVPFKSKFGNKLTKTIFKLLFGKPIKDTQTGLRAIPTSIMHHFIDLDGERFSYETDVLIKTVRELIPIKEITIETIYIEGNSETHFNPITDSIEIYYLLFRNFFKYISSSVLSFIIDILIFQLVFNLLGPISAAFRIALATISARVISSSVNYTVNKNIVFKSTKNISYSMWRYFTLVILQLTLSAVLVYLVYSVTGYQESAIKIVVDGILFFISYRIQRVYVF